MFAVLGVLILKWNHNKCFCRASIMNFQSFMKMFILIEWKHFFFQRNVFVSIIKKNTPWYNTWRCKLAEHLWKSWTNLKYDSGRYNISGESKTNLISHQRCSESRQKGCTNSEIRLFPSYHDYLYYPYLTRLSQELLVGIQKLFRYVLDSPFIEDSYRLCNIFGKSTN